jgi:hypothetical protein
MFKIISKNRYNEMAKTEIALTEQLQANKKLSEMLNKVQAELRDVKERQNRSEIMANQRLKNCEEISNQRLETSKNLSETVEVLRSKHLESHNQYVEVRATAKEALDYLRLMRRGAKSPSVQKAIDTLKEI